MESWRAPLDEFTLRYLMSRIIEDREKHLKDAQEVQKYDGDAHEAFMVRAEEDARIIKQLKKLIGVQSEHPREPPPPPPKRKGWPLD